jgi:glycine hydroxymethyltransferase
MLRLGDTIVGKSLAEDAHLTHGMALKMSGKMHVIAEKAVAFKDAMTTEFQSYQRQVLRNANELVRTVTERDLRIVSRRTESHLMLVDLPARRFMGKQAEAS